MPGAAWVSLGPNPFFLMKDKNFGIERKDETKISKKKDLRKLHTYLQTLTREEKEELFVLQHPVDKEEKAEESDSDF